MGLRLYAIYPNIDDSYTYTVQLMDDEYTGASSEVRVTSEVMYDFVGTSRDPLTKIKPTNAELSILINTAAASSYVDDLERSDEGRFWIKILKGTDIDFIGVITADQTERTNRPLDSNEQIYSITAVDGLARLKDIAYEPAISQAYFDQNQEGKLRLESDGTQSTRTAAGSWSFPFNVEVEDIGDNYPVSGGFSYPGRYTFDAYISVVGDPAAYIASSGLDTSFIIGHGADGFTATVRLYKIDINDDEIDLADPQTLTFFCLDDDATSATAARATAAFKVEDHDLLDTEIVKFSVEWDFDDDFLTLYTEATSYFETLIDAQITLQNVYTSYLDHIKGIFDLMPTYRHYSGTDAFFGVNIPHTEQDQGSDRGEDYIQIPYNAFVTDFNATPVKVVSCYEALEILLDILPGQIIYRSGQYLMMPYRYATSFNMYEPDWSYIERENKTFSAYPMQCEGRSTTSNLPALRSARYCYNRLSSLNLLIGAAAFFPPLTVTDKYTTSDVILEDRVYRLQISIRVFRSLIDTTLVALETAGKKWRHAFIATLQAGDDYAQVQNINTFKQAAPIYSSPLWSDTDTNEIDIHGPVQEALKEHVITVSFDLPENAYTGPITFGLEYDRTYVRDSSTQYTETVLTALNYSLDTLRLSTVDAADDDEVYSAKICTELSRNVNSHTIDRTTKLSDLWELEKDPGAIKVIRGGTLYRSGTWDGVSLQAAMTRVLANQFARPQKVYNGQFITNDYALGHITPEASSPYLLIEGRYYTHLNRLEGSWYRYISIAAYKLLDLTTYIETGDSSATNAINNLPSPTTVATQDSTDAATSVNETYEYYTDTEDSVYIDIPATHRLPDPSEYTDAQMMRIFSGSMKGSGNMTYRSTPTRPEHFSVDYANSRLVLGRAATIGQEYFIMWYIIKL